MTVECDVIQFGNFGTTRKVMTDKGISIMAKLVYSYITAFPWKDRINQLENKFAQT